MTSRNQSVPPNGTVDGEAPLSAAGEAANANSTHTHSSAKAPPPEGGEEIDELTRYLAIAKLTAGWVHNLSSLAMLELSRSAKAIKQSVALQIALFPMLFLFYISFCAGLAYVVYDLTRSSLYGVATLLATQLACVCLAYWRLSSLKKLIGFKHTSTQIKEVSSELAAAFK